MRHTPKTEEDFNTLFSPGDYRYEIIKSEENISKSGKPQIAITLKLISNVNTTTLANDWLQDGHYRLRHLCMTAGLKEMYESDEIHASAFLHKRGIAKVGVQKGGDDGKGGFYKDKNVINDYLPDTNTKPLIFGKTTKEPLGSTLEPLDGQDVPW